MMRVWGWREMTSAELTPAPDPRMAATPTTRPAAATAPMETPTIRPAAMMAPLDLLGDLPVPDVPPTKMGNATATSSASSSWTMPTETPIRSGTLTPAGADAPMPDARVPNSSDVPLASWMDMTPTAPGTNAQRTFDRRVAIEAFVKQLKEASVALETATIACAAEPDDVHTMDIANAVLRQQIARLHKSIGNLAQ